MADEELKEFEEHISEIERGEKMTDEEIEELTPFAQALCVLLAGEIGVGECYSVKDMDDLITIGKAMFFDEKYEQRARQIARDFEQEAVELAAGGMDADFDD